MAQNSMSGSCRVVSDHKFANLFSAFGSFKSLTLRAYFISSSFTFCVVRRRVALCHGFDVDVDVHIVFCEVMFCLERQNPSPHIIGRQLT